MSIINQMLKDLEKRAHTPINTDIALPPMPSTVFYSYKKSAKKKYAIMGSVLVLALLFLMLNYKLIVLHRLASMHVNAKSDTLIQPNISMPTVTNNPMSTPLHLTPSILTAITLQLDKDTTSLRFLLSQDSLYQITTNENNQFIILLENARLVTSIPPIDAMNSAIKEIKIVNQQDGDLKILLTLKEGVELTHLELNDAGKLPELQLDLLSTNVPDSPQVNPLSNKNFSSLPTDAIIKLRTDISVSDQYQKALQLATEGKAHDAIKMLTSILSQDPDYAAVRESLASLLITQGNTVQAEQILKTGLKQRPYFPPFVVLKARMLVDEGEINQALTLLQLAPPMLTTNPDYHAFIAALYQRQGKSQFAEKLYEQLLAVQPNNAKWWMGLGIALESMGKSTLAMEAYVKAGNSDQLTPELKIYAESRVQNLQ